MNTRFCLLTTILTIFITISSSAQYLQVDDTYTPQQLVEDVLINSDCASVSNISVSGGNFNGAKSYGYFSAAGTTFPFQGGIVLSTGRAVQVEGPNSSLLDDGGGMSWGGDGDLEGALNINNSVNATILEFDFVPLGNKISFDYMLSSEEYHDNAPCQYSDGFAFLLSTSGNQGQYSNLAVVPGTNIPVKVTSVRPQIGGNNGCNAQNEEYFGGFNGTAHPTNFNGQTRVLQAQANVLPGVAYHIKLVIADEGNYRYDSAIFIGAGSFDVISDLGPDRLVANGSSLCDGETTVLDATNPSATSYKWFKDGSEIAGQTSATYTVSAAGEYSVEVQLAASCTSDGSIIIEYAPLPPSANHTLIQCDDNDDGFTTFNLSLADALVTGGNQSFEVTYYTAPADAETGINPIQNNIGYTNTAVNQQLYARVTNQTGCHSVSTVALATSANGLNNPSPLETCDTDGNDDGIMSFDLTTKDAEIMEGLSPGLQLQYFISAEDAFAATQPIGAPSSFINTSAGTQTVYARIYNGSECFGIAALDLIVNSFGSALDDENATLCNGQFIWLSAGSGFSSYEWDTTPPQFTPAITVATPGTYTLTVTNSRGCEATKIYTVVASGAATGATIQVEDFAENQNTITVFPEGIGSYEYSLDGIMYQQDATFLNLTPGEYTVYIRDINGCGPVYTDTAYVLAYPKFFTPNGDGINDLWRIPFMQNYPETAVNIYDRYGKLVASFTGSGAGWDGTYYGKPLPATDYWFEILSRNRIIKGHFAMMR